MKNKNLQAVLVIMLFVILVAVIVGLVILNVKNFNEIDQKLDIGSPSANTSLDITIPQYDSQIMPEISVGTIGLESIIGISLGIIRTISVISTIIAIVIIVANWKIYSKANQPGWACLVPIYANVVQFKVVGLNPWLLLLYLVPGINVIVTFVFLIIVPFRLAKSFGKDLGWGFGLLFLPFIFNLILAFGSSNYVGPKGEV